MNNAQRPILTAFVDGLKPSSISRMPFLRSLEHKRRIRTDLGYSITCHATMYSGVYPQTHGMWFLWKYSPKTSPFSWLPDSGLMDVLNFLPAWYLVTRIARLFSKNTSYAGIPTIKNSAVRNWRYFDLAEHRLWDEAGYLDGVPTVFEILRDNNIRWESVGLHDLKNNGGSLSHIKSFSVKDDIPEWLYLFIGDVDYVSHFHTQESKESDQVLQDVDNEIARIYHELKNKSGCDPIFFCFSDHGHMKVEHKFEVYKHFLSHGISLDSFIHIVDINFIRFWFRTKKEEECARAIMASVPSGFFLTEEHLRKYHVFMKDNRYGDAIFYLDAPFMFQKTAWGYGLRTISIHGYLPEYREKDGVFISNLPIKKPNQIELVDILPSLLDLLDVDTTLRFDGNSIW